MSNDGLPERENVANVGPVTECGKSGDGHLPVLNSHANNTSPYILCPANISFMCVEEVEIENIGR